MGVAAEVEEAVEAVEAAVAEEEAAAEVVAGVAGVKAAAVAVEQAEMGAEVAWQEVPPQVVAPPVAPVQAVASRSEAGAWR